VGVDPVHYAASQIDLSPRVVASTVVVASPAGAAETIICQTPAPAAEAILAGVDLSGWAAFTVGASGTAARLRIRRTNVAGTVVADSGPLTGGIAAGNLVALPIQGFDTGAAQNQVYVLTLTITAGGAASTVSATALRGIVI
jgi:hypothetical protein